MLKVTKSETGGIPLFVIFQMESECLQYVHKYLESYSNILVKSQKIVP